MIIAHKWAMLINCTLCMSILIKPWAMDFTVYNTIWLLSLSSNSRTEFLTLAETVLYHNFSGYEHSYRSMSILIHRACFMIIMSYAHIINPMYELCSYYDNGFIIDELCYIISSMVFIMTPTKRKTSKVQFLWLIDKPSLNCTPKNHKHGFDLNYQRPWVTIIQRALKNGKFRTLSQIAVKSECKCTFALLSHFCASF